MRFTTIFAALSALALGANAAVILEKRVSWPCGGAGPCPTQVISEFTVFGQDGCNQDSLDSFTFRKGDDSDKCLPFAALTNNQTVKSITETAGDFKCQLTVFMKDDCSDPGLQIGIPQPGAKPGCESDNLQAFKIQCPWWN